MRKNYVSFGLSGLMAVTLLVAGCSQGATTHVSKPLTKEEGVLQLNVQKIGQELEKESKLTLENTYNKKKVQVVGQVSKKWVMSDGSLCVCIGQQENIIGKEKFYAVRVLFDVSERDEVNALKVGDFVVVKGVAGIYEPDENKGKSMFFDIYQAKIE